MGNKNNKWKIAIISIIAILCIFPASAQVFTLFNDTYSELNLDFTNSTQHSFFLTLPNVFIESARLSIAGEPYTTQSTLEADVIIVTDVSGSMGWYNPTPLSQAKIANTLFVNTVDTNNIQIGLVKYAACPNINDVLELTRNKVILNETIENYQANGATNIGGGLMLAVNEIISSRAQETDRKYILLMTDGVVNRYYDQAGVCQNSNDNGPLAVQYVINMANYAASNNITVYGIGFGAGSYLSMTLLEDVANITGGEAYYAPSGTELQEIYEQIAQTISATTYPEPIINNELPNGTISGWIANQGLNQNATWNGSDCGLSGATCFDFTQILQNAIDSCVIDSCTILFDLESSEPGILRLFDLEIIARPKGTISCIDPINPPTYLLTENEYLNFPLTDVFEFEGNHGVPNEIIVDISAGVEFSELLLPEFIGATPNGITSTNTSFIRISTDNGVTSQSCPIIFTVNQSEFPEITCAQTMPSYSIDNQITIPLNSVFNIPSGVGTPERLLDIQQQNVIIASSLPSSVIATRNNLIGTEIARITIQTNLGVYSPSCPIRFTHYSSNCENENCQTLLNNGQYEQFIAQGCTDGKINVYNRPSYTRASALYPDLRYVDFGVDSFESPYPINPKFEITRVDTIAEPFFYITGTGINHLQKGIGVMKINLLGNQEVIYCPLIERIEYDIGDEMGEIDAELLVTGSRAVAGYYNNLGLYEPKGPFIFTAKVWLRK